MLSFSSATTGLTLNPTVLDEAIANGPCYDHDIGLKAQVGIGSSMAGDISWLDLLKRIADRSLELM